MGGELDRLRNNSAPKTCRSVRWKDKAAREPDRLPDPVFGLQKAADRSIDCLYLANRGCRVCCYLGARERAPRGPPSFGRLPTQAQGQGKRATEMGEAIFRIRDELDLGVLRMCSLCSETVGSRSDLSLNAVPQ